MNYNIITHITTACNYDCSYCDVVKDKRFTSQKQRDDIIQFISNNQDLINRFKFFGGEPLLAFKDIQYIIDNTHTYIGNNFEIVTNTTMLKDNIGEYLREYFSHIFFSIDSENTFNYGKVLSFIEKYELEKKMYFNLIISPGKEDFAFEQFQKLYGVGMRGFNILPVYFTQKWRNDDLKKLSQVMKNILDISLDDSSLRLYGFMENSGYDTSLANNTIFVDIDGSVYYSDIASTFSGKEIKTELSLGDISSFYLKDIENHRFEKEKNAINLLEQKIYRAVPGQQELHKIMDYFSHYLTIKNG